MRLIDAEALLDAISVHLERIEQELDDAKTIDPVRHGEWIDSSNGWMCTSCEMDTSKDWNYCPNCGAKMDGGEE